MRSILALSILANALLLAAWILGRRNQVAPAPAIAESPEQRVEANSAPPKPRAGGPLPGGSHTPIATNAIPDWSTIESADYREYVKRLRAAGVPEDIVRDLIMADVRKAYGPRANAILGDRQAHHFWQKFHDQQPTPDQLRRLDRLEREEQDVIAAVLGVKPTIQSMIDRLFLQVDDRDVALDFLPLDRQEAARKALEAAGVRHQEMNDPDLADRYGDEVERRRMKLRFDVLGGVLSAGELAEYRARLAPENGEVRQRTGNIDITEAEYRQLLEIHGADAGADARQREKRLNEAARQVLGEERFAEYEKSANFTYRFSREAAQRYNLPVSVADEIIAMKRTTQAAGEALWGSDLSREEKIRRGTALREQAQRTLWAKLGPDGYAFVSRDAAWLQLLELPHTPQP